MDAWELLYKAVLVESSRRFYVAYHLSFILLIHVIHFIVTHGLLPGS
jgi:hypothetical protein